MNGYMSMIRTETERYDIVDFCKVTVKSLAWGTGSYRSQMNQVRTNLQVNVDPGQDKTGVKTRLMWSPPSA